jgi:hypothetical protein
VYLDATILESPVANAAFQRLNKALTSIGVISPSHLALELSLRFLRQRDPKRFNSVDGRDTALGIEMMDEVERVI